MFGQDSLITTGFLLMAVVRFGTRGHLPNRVKGMARGTKNGLCLLPRHERRIRSKLVSKKRGAAQHTHYGSAGRERHQERLLPVASTSRSGNKYEGSPVNPGENRRDSLSAATLEMPGMWPTTSGEKEHSQMSRAISLAIIPG